ncbi:TPA: lytic transglycosylase domain-containing protein [Kluyvera ascorbata]|nr:lytic transglycosylase domain-containing protein [Kluyvera ascorbata]
MIDFPAIALQCGPEVATEVIQRIVTVESSFNPYAIGVVGGRLERQPKTEEEAVVTAKYLANHGWNFSMGLAQINRYNLQKYGLDYHSVFDVCSNLRAAASIYDECFNRALSNSDFSSARLKAFSCYYSGNFSRGFIADGTGNTSYVDRITSAKVGDGASNSIAPIPIISNDAKKGNVGKINHQDSRGNASRMDSDNRHLRKINVQNDDSGGIKQLRGD